MRLSGSDLTLSATDLSNFLGCRHRTALDLAAVHGHRQRRRRGNMDPLLEVLIARGNAHEQQYVDSFRAQGRTVVDLTEFKNQERDAHVDATIAAMREGPDVIVQGALRDTCWFGYPDVLLRVDRPSALGDGSYEVVDTKLSRETRAGTILQLGLYTEMLGIAQGFAPEWFHVVTPDPVTPQHSYRTDDYAAYFRLIRLRLRETSEMDHAIVYENYYPEPVEHCEICHWYGDCRDRWREDDHLSLVAGINRLQRRELETHNITTLADLAAMPLPLEFKPKRGSAESYERIREQARLQFESRDRNPPLHKRREIAKGFGFCMLPDPDLGDIFLDLEGDPFASTEGGREYLFGLVTIDENGVPQYRSFWGFTPRDERRAFEEVMDLITTTIEKHPGAHIYHYAPYEPSAFKRLMGRYATKERELDRLLRAGRFVDLYHVVRQAIIAGVERYSIKNLEVFYGFDRDVDLAVARRNLHIVEQGIELDTMHIVPQEVLDAVEGYNRDDCVSTLKLRNWLEGLRSEAIAEGIDVPRPVPGDSEPSKELSEREKEVELLRGRLIEGISDDPAERTNEEQARWLVAYMLDFHRREDKVTWWEYFRLSDLPEDDLKEEPAAIAGVEFVERLGFTIGKTGKPTKTVIDRYRYPAQEMEIKPGEDLWLKRELTAEEEELRQQAKAEGQPASPGAKLFGKVVDFDRAARTVDISKGPSRAEIHPTALFAHTHIPATAQEDALFRLGESIAASGISGLGKSAAHDLLLRMPPRLRGASFARPAPDDVVDYAASCGLRLDHGVLCIQGPPGAGKTFAGGRMIRALLEKGLRVGVTANGHKVIRNLLESAADAPGPPLRIAHHGGEEWTRRNSTCEVTTKNPGSRELLQTGEVMLMGATAWMWSREEFANSIDVLFVDEAGQMALPNVLAVSHAAKSLVLLGDPQQLEQPSKGSHPDGVSVSALHHMLDGHKTMPEHLGLFLPETWRLHPELCSFTSEMFYEGRLNPRAGLERQALSGMQHVDGSGLWYVDVEHDGNRNSSSEEVNVVVDLVMRLLQGNSTWTDREGVTKPLTTADILVVAPYNAQVTRLIERLHATDVRVGTVDKFQGQEAPIVIYSATTSHPEDAPRGMEFLYSPNRLNVATSRAKCAAFLIASPHLFEPECKTPRQMKLANAFCRYREMARAVPGESPV
jgi:predicted RecB family nuclease